MLGIRRPDSHALPRIPPTKRADRDPCSPPASGFVHRRVSPVAPRRREGPLTEPTPGAQPWPRERVLMPHCRPCPGRICGSVRRRKRPFAIGWDRSEGTNAGPSSLGGMRARSVRRLMLRTIFHSLNCLVTEPTAAGPDLDNRLYSGKRMAQSRRGSHRQRCCKAGLVEWP